MAGELELVDLVAGLRAELEEARVRGADAGIGFEVGPVELELTVSVTKKGAGKTGVRFLVVTGEVSGELATATTQRIKLTLSPTARQQTAEGTAGNVQQEQGSVVIHGDELPGEQ